MNSPFTFIFSGTLPGAARNDQKTSANRPPCPSRSDPASPTPTHRGEAKCFSTQTQRTSSRCKCRTRAQGRSVMCSVLSLRRGRSLVRWRRRRMPRLRRGTKIAMRICRHSACKRPGQHRKIRGKVSIKSLFSTLRYRYLITCNTIQAYLN